MARLLRNSQRRPLYRHARLGQGALRARYVESHGVSHSRKQAAAGGAGLLEEIQRREPSNRRAGRTRPQIEACVVAGLRPATAILKGFLFSGIITATPTCGRHIHARTKPDKMSWSQG